MTWNNGHFRNSAPKEVVIDSYAGIIARPRQAGLIYYAQDQKTYYGDNGVDLVDLGGGGLGSPSNYATLDCESSDNRVANWDVTGLTLATLTENDSTPLNGKRSYAFTNAVGAEGEKALFTIDLPLRSTLKEANIRGASLAFDHTGTPNKVMFVFYNSLDEIIGQTMVDKASGTLLLLTANDEQTIKFGIEVYEGEVGTITFDDVVISDDPTTMIDIKNDQGSITLLFKATALETGFIASAQSDVHKHANNKSPVEKVVGTWDSGNGKQALYEKSYYRAAGGAISNPLIDATIGHSSITPVGDNWRYDSVRWRCAMDEGTSMELESGQLELVGSFYGWSVTVQYVKNSENP